ncbi:hypothetical protein, partial [Acidithiobacillus thiooxidans]|uniref:hypothetical protein n=1 Tax=Acidithiobacillus thiooxidans TaxID=930 RepID=UPI001C07A0AC
MDQFLASGLEELLSRPSDVFISTRSIAQISTNLPPVLDSGFFLTRFHKINPKSIHRHDQQFIRTVVRELYSKVVYGRVTTGLNEVAYCCYKGF